MVVEIAVKVVKTTDDFSRWNPQLCLLVYKHH